jgi:hypothetical protein
MAIPNGKQLSSLSAYARIPVNGAQMHERSAEEHTPAPGLQALSALPQPVQIRDLVEDIHSSRWHRVNASCRRIVFEEPYLSLKDFQRPMLAALKSVRRLITSSAEYCDLDTNVLRLQVRYMYFFLFAPNSSNQ